MISVVWHHSNSCMYACACMCLHVKCSMQTFKSKSLRLRRLWLCISRSGKCCWTLQHKTRQRLLLTEAFLTVQAGISMQLWARLSFIYPRWWVVIFHAETYWYGNCWVQPFIHSVWAGWWSWTEFFLYIVVNAYLHFQVSRAYLDLCRNS